MPALPRAKKKSTAVRIRHLVDPDALVICLSSFRPYALSRMFIRGDYLKLSDAIVREFPAQFALVIPLERLDDLREIER